MSGQPSLVAAPFSVNAGTGQWSPGTDQIMSSMSPALANNLMRFGMQHESLRPWINMTPQNAMVKANLMDLALQANDLGMDVDQFFGGIDAYVTVNGKNYRVNAATLLKDEWKQYDDVVLQVAQERLVAVGDVLAAGCVLNIPNALGTTVLEYEHMTHPGEASISMDAGTRGRSDKMEFTLNYLPLPIVHEDFSLTIRALTASRKRGTALDTLRAAAATRNVTEYIENMFFNGPGGTATAATFVYGGGTIYGCRNFSNRNTYTTMADWGSSGITGLEVLKDVLNMKQLMINDKQYGPYMIYIPTAYETVLDDEFKTNSDKPIRQRIMEIGGIAGIKVADKLPDDNVIMIELKPETVRMCVGFQPMMLEWQAMGGMQFEYKVMSIMVPQFRADADTNCGIVHGTTS
jgi:hypothetical protein